MSKLTPALLALACLSLTACDDLSPLDRSCLLGHPCWEINGEMVYDVPEWMDVGECSSGVVIKDAESDECICSGRIYPENEICDGLDNNCDGKVDTISLMPQNPANTCNTSSTCRNAKMTCVDSTWFCERDPEATDEVCDGIDNDCDGDVDDGLSLPVYSYPEDQYPGTVGIGECRPGIDRCSNGGPVHVDPVVPQSEVASDGKDNDCDGLVDECGIDVEPLAVALVIDVSGSMQGSLYLPTLTEAVCDGSVTALIDRMAIVVVAAGLVKPYVSTILDFTDTSSACDIMLAPGDFWSSNVGSEYMLEGVDRAFTTLTWPTGHGRTTVAFGDELIKVDVATEATIVGGCIGSDISLISYTTPAHDYEWQAMTASCDGSVEMLSTSSEIMRGSLIDVFSQRC